MVPPISGQNNAYCCSSLITQLQKISKKIEEVYQQFVKAVMSFFSAIHLPLVGKIMGAILGEPIVLLKTFLYYPFGMPNPCKYNNMNPETISERQAQKKPILLIHGNFHNPSAFFALVDKITRSDLGPVYSVHLEHGGLKQADLERINDKITRIGEQYRQHGYEAKIDLIGHSRGAVLAFLTGISDREITEGGTPLFGHDNATNQAIGKVIRLGTNTCSYYRDNAPEQYLDQVYEVYGTRDALIDTPSQADPSHQCSVNTGHFGVLYSNEAHSQIINWLKA